MAVTKLVPLILAGCLTLGYSDAGAGEADYSAVHYFAAGLLLADVGASVANGVAPATGKPNRLNGYFGVDAGAVSLGLVKINYANTACSCY